MMLNDYGVSWAFPTPLNKPDAKYIRTKNSIFGYKLSEAQLPNSECFEHIWNITEISIHYAHSATTHYEQN